MEIKLNDDDIVRVANVAMTNLERKLLQNAMSSEAFNEVSKQAKAWAEMHFKGSLFVAEAKEAVREMLKQEGKQVIRELVQEAIREEIKNDPTLVKAAKRALSSVVLDEISRLQDDADYNE